MIKYFIVAYLIFFKYKNLIGFILYLFQNHILDIWMLKNIVLMSPYRQKLVISEANGYIFCVESSSSTDHGKKSSGLTIFYTSETVPAFVLYNTWWF